jgi:hypothetical protein
MAGPTRRNVRTAEYKDLESRLPQRIIKLSDLKFDQFCENPTHPSLRSHPLGDDGRGRHRPGSVSVAINMQYRAIYVVDGDTNVWYWVGSHNDYDVYTGRR